MTEQVRLEVLLSEDLSSLKKYEQDGKRNCLGYQVILSDAQELLNKLITMNCECGQYERMLKNY